MTLFAGKNSIFWGPSPTPKPPQPTPTPVPGGHQYYCPGEGDYDFLDGAKWTGNGWTINGEGRVYGKVAFDMIGGYVEFDLDTSNAYSDTFGPIVMSHSPLLLHGFRLL